MQAPPTLIHVIWSDPIPFADVVKFVGPTDFGVYAIYGTHPVHGSNVLLYIGRSRNGSFGWRVPQHEPRLKDEGVQEIRVHLGRLAGATTPPDAVWNNEITWAELLLICAHEPPLNKKVGLGISDSALNSVHVCNWENRADILPEVSGFRWTTAGGATPKNIYRAGDGDNESNATALSPTVRNVPRIVRECHVLLAVRDFGDDPSVVTELLGLTPTEQWQGGDRQSPASSHTWKSSGWCLHSPLPSHANPGEHLEALLPLLEPHAVRIRECASRFTTRINCCVVYDSDLPAAFEISASLISRIAELQLSLLFDSSFPRCSKPD